MHLYFDSTLNNFANKVWPDNTSALVQYMPQRRTGDKTITSTNDYPVLGSYICHQASVGHIKQRMVLYKFPMSPEKKLGEK